MYTMRYLWNSFLEKSQASLANWVAHFEYNTMAANQLLFLPLAGSKLLILA